MKKLFASLLAVFMAIPSAYAINTDNGVWTAWDYGDEVQWSNYGEFVLAGGIGKGGTHGTHEDEWGLVGVIAQKIVEHGGYFCAYQFQCANQKKQMKSWSVYYYPNGWTSNKCMWLCESGYGGENCEKLADATDFCDPQILKPSTEGALFNGLSMKTTGGDADGKEGEVTGFSTWQHGRDHGIRRRRDQRETDVLLGAVEFLDHGIIAKPVKLECRADDWKDINSWVESVYASTSDGKLLCMPGYQANEDGTDCVAIDQQICDIETMTLCANFPRDKFESSIHTLVAPENTGGCAKYFCTAEGTAFQALNDPTCVECGIPVKDGANLSNGTCMLCDMGEYYDSETGTCKPANAYSKTDLQYGLNQTKNTQSDVDMQCWPAKVPEEYVECVKKGYRAQPMDNKFPLVWE